MSELVVEAKPENLDVVLDFFTKNLETANCPIKQQMQIAIVAEEIFMNIAHYAYKPNIGKARINLSISDYIVIEFEDKGKPYNPLEKEDPNITESAEKREVGGLGIFMVKKIMDSVEYKYKENKNIFTVKKKFAN